MRLGELRIHITLNTCDVLPDPQHFSSDLLLWLCWKFAENTGVINIHRMERHSCKACKKIFHYSSFNFK